MYVVISCEKGYKLVVKKAKSLPRSSLSKSSLKMSFSPGADMFYFAIEQVIKLFVKKRGLVQPGEKKPYINTLIHIYINT